MAQYFPRPRARPSFFQSAESNSHPTTFTSTAHPAQREPQQEAAVPQPLTLSLTSLDQSIYIFPNPPSASSPDALHSRSSSLTPSSLFSAPSEFTFSGFDDEGGEVLGRDMSRSRSGSRVSAISRSRSTGSSGIEVEVWDPDWTGEEDEGDILVEEGEEDLERTSRWHVYHPFPSQPLPRDDDLMRTMRPRTISRHPLDPTRIPNPISNSNYAYTLSLSRRHHNQQMRSRTQSQSLSPLRLRTQSQVSYASLSSSRSQPPPPPHPSLHLKLPLLSFITSLLSIDESTIHLITTTPATATTCGKGEKRDSVLFDGAELHSGSLFLDDESDDVSTTSSEGENPPTHGLLKFFHFAGTSETKSLLTTIRHNAGGSSESDEASAETDRERPNLLVVPNIDLFGLWGLVSGMFGVSGKAWREVWATSERTTTVVDV
ncbi:hypothetical protein JAAARDRAFT_189655 [Jaapia argillacea MUCL 33604]|uniref:Uncharacterized protein n=1 Tax=Jaapia argillacea MUCL 33604 TaxID=933084 RepID=A0A067Q5I8_9AGAM|nr:hypothetical protein JAAARDRAFT_189655 [Jaapia argillacea MUCL 33604]